MKKLKIFLSLILIILTFSVVSSNIKASDQSYLEAKDFITLEDDKDNTSEIVNFLNICNNLGMDAYFNSGIYILKSSISLVGGVSIIGSDYTVFRGVNGDYQVNIFDGTNTKDITIKNIIFDNVTIYSQNESSTNWVIENNIFINAKKVDTSIDSGLVPDSNNQNGGENTGYYILSSKKGITIRSNLFLRDENSLGRGIGLYQSTDALIEDNYFGLVEDIDNSIVSLNTKSLKDKVLSLDTYNDTSNQGYFMTAINVISGDTNTKILSNHISLNKDISEANYEDGSGLSLGYNRDHIIYAKEYTNLAIVGNYFKGQNKNQDGGIKIRNGNGSLVYKNIFEDVTLLYYIQDYSSVTSLTNTYAAENIFLNQDITSSSLTVGTQTKYPTQTFLIFFYNYLSNANISNFTIENNKVISLGLGNEEIRLYTPRSSSDTIYNLTIRNNTNYIGEELNLNNYFSVSGDTYYIDSNLDLYGDIDVYSLLNLAEVDFKIENKKLVGNNLYLNQEVYNNTTIELDTDYEVFSVESTTETIKVEGSDYTLPSNIYYLSTFNIKSEYEIEVNLGDTISLLDILPVKYFNDIVIISNSNFSIEDLNITALSLGTNTLDIILDEYNIKLIIKANLVLNVDESYNYDFSNLNLSYNQNVLNISDNSISSSLIGIHSVDILDNNLNIINSFIVEVVANNNYVIDKTIYLSEVFNLPEELLNQVSYSYDSNNITIDGNFVYFNNIGLYTFDIIGTNFSIRYNIEVIEDIEVSDITISLGESLELDLGDYTYIYDETSLSISGNVVTGLKVGSHGISIYDYINNKYISFKIIVIA